MSGKHTPGPWEIKPHNSWNSARREYVPDEGCYSQIGPIDVGVTYADDAWIAATEADARLIAAAPDLLEALRMADDMFSNPGRINKTTVRDAVRAAIAKAEDAA